MSIVTEAVFGKNAAQYFKSAIKLDEPVVVATNFGNAVIINEATLKGLTETAYLNNIEGMADSIIEGARTPWNECVKVDWKNELRG